MTWYLILFFFFSFLGIFLGILFFLKRKGDHLANVLLGLYTILFAYELLQNCLRWSGHLREANFVHLSETHWPIWLVYGPLVYIYVRRVVTGVAFKLADLLFLIPPLAVFSLLYPFYKLSAIEKIVVGNEGTFYEIILVPYPNGIWYILLVMATYGLYTYFSFWQNKRIGFRENIWLKWFVGSYCGFVFLFALYVYLIRSGIMNPKYDYFIDIFIVFFIGLLAFFGFVQPEVFEGKSLKEVIPSVKYRKTGLSEALSLEMKNKLLETIKKEQLYLNNSLRLDDLATKINLSSNHTSQIINEHFNLSFFDFVNKFRIDEAKNLLLQNKQDGTTITQLAYDVGFNNRASFYKAFKKFADDSPSNYIRHIEAS